MTDALDRRVRGGDYLPDWAFSDVKLRHRNAPTNDLWEQDDAERFSRIIHIAYPNGVYYVVDKLVDSEWLEQDSMHFVPETAISMAQKKSYYDQVPYRVREVVWRG